MICRLCGGQVVWEGPITDLTHTECKQCGAINCQLPDDDQIDEEPRCQDSASQ